MSTFIAKVKEAHLRVLEVRAHNIKEVSQKILDGNYEVIEFEYLYDIETTIEKKLTTYSGQLGQ